MGGILLESPVHRAEQSCSRTVLTHTEASRGDSLRLNGVCEKKPMNSPRYWDRRTQTGGHRDMWDLGHCGTETPGYWDTWT